MGQNKNWLGQKKKKKKKKNRSYMNLEQLDAHLTRFLSIKSCSLTSLE
jgi:hypothetical protein